ncbi:phage major capsid family protein [Halococcus hamelinensis]|uniref:Phage major capsid protein n=1 Tax=Halococcus hamelinensis 100A6 TaxID=1132509 RepID=M0LYF2_9EURY|nr:phage major capsid protein [Halococcus hamelinensis]EMA38466.1 hypothetical protein C447_09937 [Halococcus hamelinensis 100A6]
MSQTQRQPQQDNIGFQKTVRPDGQPVVKTATGQELSKEQAIAAVRQKNSEIIKQITTGDFENGGRLNRQQFARFYQEVIANSNILNMVRVEPVDGPDSEIDRIGVGEHLLRPVGENERVIDHSVNTGKVDIDVYKAGFGWDLSQEVVEDSIEYENTAQIILSMFTDQFAFDVATLGFQGDEDATVSDGSGGTMPDPFYSQVDGWVANATDDGADVKGYNDAVTLNEGVMFNLTLQMPDKFIDATSPAIMAHPKQVVAYRRSLSDRNTSLGDEMLTSGRIPTPTGYPLVPTNAIGTDTVMFTDTSNLIYAPHRDMNVKVTTDSEKVVKNDLFAQYGVFARLDYAVEQGNAVAIAEELAEPEPVDPAEM